MSLPIFKAFVITPGYFQMFDFHINFKIISKSSPHPERSRTLGETNVYVNMRAHLNVYVNIRRIYLNMYVNIRRSHLNVYVINIRRNSLNVYADMRRTNFFSSTRLSHWSFFLRILGVIGRTRWEPEILYPMQTSWAEKCPGWFRPTSCGISEGGASVRFIWQLFI